MTHKISMLLIQKWLCLKIQLLHFSAENLGNDQFCAFVDGRLTKDTPIFYETVSKHNPILFKSGTDHTAAENKSKVAGMTSDLQLFSRLLTLVRPEGVILMYFFNMRINLDGVLREASTSLTGNSTWWCQAIWYCCLCTCLRQLTSPEWVDVVSDYHIADSLKSDTRKTHGIGMPLWVKANMYMSTFKLEQLT